MVVSITISELALAAGVDTETATRMLMPVATQIVEDYAVNAPTVLQDAAVVRYVGYLGKTAGGAITSKTVGPVSQTFQSNDAAMFRNSGAESLLTRYKVRRAGKI